MTSFDAARRAMVDCQLRTFDVSDRAVLAAMAEVPRERFLPVEQVALAYSDRDVPLAEGEDPRAMLAPMVTARLLQALTIKPGDRVLDVGGGRGYVSALLCALGAQPVLLETRADLADAAAERLGPGVTIRRGPLEAGAPDDGPFDKILVGGAMERRPEALLDQLAIGGRLAGVSTESGIGRAVLFVRSEAGVGHRTLFDAAAPALAGFRQKPGFVF